MSLIDQPLSAEKFSLVAFDLDGTVLDSVKRTISPRVQHALQAIRDRGAQTAVVSGRPLHMLGKTLLTAHWVDWFVTTNGALILNAHTCKHIFESVMSHTVIASIFDMLADLQPAWMLCSEHMSYREKRGVTYLAGQSSSLNTQSPQKIMQILSDVNFVDSLPGALHEISVPIYKIGVSFPSHSRSTEAVKRLKRQGGLEVFIMSPIELEITLSGVDKGAAIRHICGVENLDIAHSVAFGDSGNDIAMAGAVGTFVAMANGTEAVRKAADFICPPITEDGVATWLEARMPRVQRG